MNFNIGKAQQKIFVDNFMQQVLDLSLQLVDQGRSKESPGETIDGVARAVIQQLYRLRATLEPGEGEGGDDDTRH